MPAVYAHASFGKKVFKLLSGECRETVKRYKRYYMLGLQGPDILFFYRPFYPNSVVKNGLKIHHEEACGFIGHLAGMVKRYGKDSPECAYVLGFICHYMLDTACHPFVDEEIGRTGIDHISLETELEISLMAADGIDPYTYDLRRVLPYDEDMPLHISRVYPGISRLQVREAVVSMRAAKHFLTCKEQNRWRIKLMRADKHFAHKLVYPHMICPGKGYDTDYSDKELKRLMDESVVKTSDIIMEFYRNQTVGSVFNMNFYGRKL